MDAKAIVLLSGGLDSVYNFYRAHKEFSGQIEALFINYGQRAFSAEKTASQFFADQLNVPWQMLDLTDVFNGSSSALTSSKQVPTDSVDIDSFEASTRSASQVWVPNRNGVLLNVAACVAEKKGAQFIVPGFNSEEAATFPDNSVEFIEKTNKTLAMSTANQVEVMCFSQEMDKNQIVTDARKLEVPLEKIWSCYFDGDSPCGKCESCQRFQRARAQSK